MTPAVNLKTDLVWWWDLAAATATITDQHSGLVLSRVNTTTTNATGGPDGGGCIDFGASGGNKYSATVAKTISYDDGFTANIWAFSTGASTGNWLINHRSQNVGSPSYFQIIARLSGLDYTVTTSNTSATRAPANTNAALNVWQMLTLVDDGTTTSMYRNGTFVASDATALPARSTGSAPFAIGGNAWSANAPLDHRGRLAMAGVWNAPLTQAAITSLYNAGAGKRYASL